MGDLAPDPRPDRPVGEVDGASLIRAWLTRAAERVGAAAAALTELDARIGDGDHGINLERGFRALRSRLAVERGGSSVDLLRLAGRTLVSTVGGAAGPLYGTFFLAMADASPDRGRATTVELADRWQAAATAVGRRGRSTTGEKTMLDVLVPVGGALRAAADAGDPPRDALRRAATVADDACAATRPMVATKGRASYLGERSRGHVDPGAASSALIVRALAEALDQASSGAGASR